MLRIEIKIALLAIESHRVYVQTPTKPPFETNVKSVAKAELIKSARFII